ncbi:MAG: hypothetical protein DMF82_06740 [Acidobacteria bacterium]|nr:MAG: hypothetical protein DMF82_06740 [Acidobacteriota bacterium]
MMKRQWTLLILGAALLFASRGSLQPLEADNARILVTGGGQGTFGSDLDRDGSIDGSYFGIGIARGERGDDDNEKGDAAPSSGGHFVCAMWGNTHILGLPLMAVEGQVNSESVRWTKRKVTFRGVGTVDLGTGPAGFFTNVPFEVTVTPGGPGVGTLKLTVIGAFDGVPGDTIPGNGNYDLPVETVSSGYIRTQ